MDPLTLAGKRIGQMIHPTMGDLEMAPDDGSVKLDAPFPTGNAAGVRALEKATGARLGTGPGGLFVAPGFQYGYMGPEGSTMDPSRVRQYQAPRPMQGGVWNPNLAAPLPTTVFDAAPGRVANPRDDYATRRGYVYKENKSPGGPVTKAWYENPDDPNDVLFGWDLDGFGQVTSNFGKEPNWQPSRDTYVPHGAGGDGYQFAPDLYGALNAWDQAYRAWQKSPIGPAPVFETGNMSRLLKDRVFDPYYERLGINRALDSPNEAGNAWYQGRLVGTRDPLAALGEIGKAKDIAGTVAFLRNTFGPEMLEAYDLPGAKEGGFMRQIGEAIVKAFGGYGAGHYASPAVKPLQEAGFDPAAIQLLTGQLPRDIDEATLAQYWKAFDENQLRPGETRDQQVARQTATGSFDRWQELQDVLRGWRTVENVPGAGPQISGRIADPANAPESKRVSRVPPPPQSVLDDPKTRNRANRSWLLHWQNQQKQDAEYAQASPQRQAEMLAEGYLPEGAPDRFVELEPHARVPRNPSELLAEWKAAGAPMDAVPEDLRLYGWTDNQLRLAARDAPAFMQPTYGEAYAARPEQGGSPAFLNPDGTSKNIAYGTSPVSALLDRMNATGKAEGWIESSYRPLQEGWDRYTGGQMTEAEMDAFDTRIGGMLGGTVPLLDPGWRDPVREAPSIPVSSTPLPTPLPTPAKTSPGSTQGFLPYQTSDLWPAGPSAMAPAGATSRARSRYGTGEAMGMAVDPLDPLVSLLAQQRDTKRSVSPTMAQRRLAAMGVAV